MKIGVLADIHGNLHAFEAVMKELKKENIDKIIIAGDLISDCPFPKEILSRSLEIDAWVIRGNRENYIIDYKNGLSDEWNEHDQTSVLRWTYDEITTNDIKYIEKLEEQTSVIIDGKAPIKIVHGSPRDVYEHLYADKYFDRLDYAVESITEEVLICGHTHQPWNTKYRNKLIVNPGSTGVNQRTHSGADYAVLTWRDNMWCAENKEVKYDFDKFKSDYIKSGIMDSGGVWAKVILQSIKKGENTSNNFVQYAKKLAWESGCKDFKLIPNEFWRQADKDWNWDI